MRINTRPASVVAIVAMLIAAAPAAGAAPPASGVKGNGDSGAAQMSRDGRFVAFTSTATNLDPDDSDPAESIFVRDRATQTTRLVSRAPGTRGASAGGASNVPSISNDGRYVAFDSAATNLDPAATAGVVAAYVRDTRAASTTLVSRATGAGGAPANADIFEPRLSADGSIVVFTSRATNLDPADSDAFSDVFVRDLRTNVTRLVSPAAPNDEEDGEAYQAVLSDDGRFVAFVSQVRPRYAESPFGYSRVLLRDLLTNALALVSRADGPNGIRDGLDPGQPGISGDGRFVTYASQNGMYAGEREFDYDVLIRDMQAHTTTVVSRATGIDGALGSNHSEDPAAVSSDGRFVGFDSRATNFAPVTTDVAGANGDIFLRDLVDHTTTLVSRATGASGADASRFAYVLDISGDGRLVLFGSDSPNLDPQDTDTRADVFIRDIAAATTTLVSRATGDPRARPPFAGCTLRSTAFVGSAARDVYPGTRFEDVVIGRAGDDDLRGGGAPDCLYGDAGDDRLRGGAGADRVFGGAGDDRLAGDAGADRITGGGGTDHLAGGAGNDRIDAVDSTRRAHARRDVVSCGTGRHDVAIVDRLDRIARDCERVRRRR